MVKRIISLLLTLGLLLSMLPAISAAAAEDSRTNERENPFSDLKEDDWYYKDALYVLEKGLFNGISDSLFSPNGTMTRAMYVTVLGRMAGIDPKAYTETSFKDVSSDSWYAPYVTWARGAGISEGIGEGRFNPDGLINREQMAVFTVRFFDAFEIAYPEAEALKQPSDFEEISDYAKDAVMKLWSCGLFKGDAEGNFNPVKNATRAEAAAFCSRTEPVITKQLEEAKEAAEPTPSPSQSPIETGTNPPVYTPSYAVDFMDGSRLIQRLYAYSGSPLSSSPGNEKTAKEGYYFAGWYTDKALTSPYYPGDPVLSNMTVYAKYEEIVKEELTLSSFSLMDQAPDLSFTVQRLGTATLSLTEGIALEVMDGSAPVTLNIEQNDEGLYIVSAQDGFREGASYKLTLGEGYIFYNKPESIRSASFSILKEEVHKLSLNSDMVFIKDTEDMSYTLSTGETVPVLEAVLLNSSTTSAVTGSFEYVGEESLAAGTVLCIYEDFDPRQRDYVNLDYSDYAEAYIEVTSIDGKLVYFTSLDEGDTEKVVFIPETIPFSVSQLSELPEGDTGTVDTAAVDNTAREAMGLSINPVIEVGDFLVFYVGAFADLEEGDSVYYGVVTSISGTAVSYKRSSKEEISSSMDSYLQQAADGDALLEGVDVQALENQILQQVSDSGFAEEAAEYLVMMAAQTEGFKSIKRLSGLVITDEQGKALSNEQIELLGLGAKIKLKNKVEITVKLESITKSNSKYLDKGVRLALGIKAEFEKEAGEGKIVFKLAATFVEEISVNVTASAKADIKWVLFVPTKIRSLTFNSSIDLKNYSGISVDVRIFTVEKEDETVWTKLKSLTGGQFAETLEKIEELKDKITEAKDTAEQLNKYKADLEALWSQIPSDVTNKAEYEGMLETLGELNVTQQLMDMLHLTDEEELDAGVRNLMERYSELMQSESDWIEILNKEIFSTELHPWIFAISIEANFIIRGNLNIALGANLEYVVGKRYSFWFDIVSKTSGSSVMDLLDERFAFQFYVMGQLGLKMGVEVGIHVGIISTKIGSIGVTAEFGPYIKLWGYFIYEYTKLRPANTSTWTYDERMMGALYLEFGLYLKMTFKAQALGLFKYQPTLLDKEWPLLTAGTRKSVYDFAYAIDKNEVLQVKDSDLTDGSVITMTLPESYRQMAYIDLCEGSMEQEIYPYDKFSYTLSNSNFILDKNTGLITVTVPENVQYMSCNLTITWKTDKLAFSLYDLAVVIPLYWTNLSDEELNERFMVSVKAGNANDGYTTVWSQRVMKNALFDLPEDAEIRAILAVDSYEAGANGNLKYSAVTGYGNQSIKDLTVLRDTTYYYEVTPRTYTVTVKDVQNKNGSKSNLNFTAKYGEKFNFTGLQSSGTEDDESSTYTSFLRISAKDGQDKEILRDFGVPIDKAFAAEILSGASYTAEYADNSAAITFRFEGIDLAPIEVKMKKGSLPSSIYFDEEIAGNNALIKSISPAFAPVTGPVTYTIICEIQEAPIQSRTLTFNTNGGTAIAQQTHPAGSVITKPNDPLKTGYNFEGWYSNSYLTQVFTFSNMPDEDITVYAKWTGKEYTLSFDENGGDELPADKGSKKVIYGEAYGQLPVPERVGYSFAGWYTLRAEGVRVSAETITELSEDITLYARWSDKPAIDNGTITVAPNQSYAYDGEAHSLVFNTGTSGIGEDSFVLWYKRQNIDKNWQTSAICAGTYDVKITRAEDAAYQSYEKTFTNVMTITKIGRSINAVPTGSSYKANILINELPANAYPGDGNPEYAISTAQTVPATGWQTSRVFMNLNQGSYYLFVRIAEGENYLSSNTVVSASSIYVEGINPNALGFIFAVNVKTSNIANAGTDSIIKGQIGFIDGVKSDLTHFDNDGNDFEKGDSDSYTVSGITRDPWMINEVTIDYTRSGSAPGWHCEYVKPLAEKLYGISSFPYYAVEIISGEQMNVGRWFEDSHNVWTGSTASMKRVITSVGNFNEIADEIILDSQNTEAYTFTYNGLVTDQYSQGAHVVNYNAYDHNDAPLLSINTADSSYKNCISYTINSISIDRAALYAAMTAKGDTTIDLTVSLKFPERSTTAATASYTKTIRVTLGD